MTPGKEGPGKGKNITVLADFFSSGQELSKLSSNFYRGLKECFCSVVLCLHNLNGM